MIIAFVYVPIPHIIVWNTGSQINLYYSRWKHVIELNESTVGICEMHTL